MRIAVSANKYPDTLRSVAKRAHTIPAPAWWVAEVGARVQTGRGRRRADDERMPQIELGVLLAKQYGERGTYHPSEVSRCVLGEVVPMELAAQISDVLEIPLPFYVPSSPLESEAMALASESPETVLRLARRIVAAAHAGPSHHAHTDGVRRNAEVAEDAVRSIVERVGVTYAAGETSRSRQGRALHYDDDEGEMASTPRARRGTVEHAGSRTQRHRG